MDVLSSLAGNNILLLVLILAWVLSWKGVALWKAAMREEKWWFVALFIINTFGILDIFYIFFIARRHEERYTQFDEENLDDVETVEEVEDGSQSEAVDEEEPTAAFDHSAEEHQENTAIEVGDEIKEEAK